MSIHQFVYIFICSANNILKPFEGTPSEQKTFGQPSRKPSGKFREKSGAWHAVCRAAPLDDDMNEMNDMIDMKGMIDMSVMNDMIDMNGMIEMIDNSLTIYLYIPTFDYIYIYMYI